MNMATAGKAKSPTVCGTNEELNFLRTLRKVAPLSDTRNTMITPAIEARNPDAVKTAVAKFLVSGNEGDTQTLQRTKR